MRGYEVDSFALTFHLVEPYSHKTLTSALKGVGEPVQVFDGYPNPCCLPAPDPQQKSLNPAAVKHVRPALSVSGIQ